MLTCASSVKGREGVHDFGGYIGIAVTASTFWEYFAMTVSAKIGDAIDEALKPMMSNPSEGAEKVLGLFNLKLDIPLTEDQKAEYALAFEDDYKDYVLREIPKDVARNYEARTVGLDKMRESKAYTQARFLSYRIWQLADAKRISALKAECEKRNAERRSKRANKKQVPQSRPSSAK